MMTNNLSDVTDKAMARLNLGLGDMSLQNKDNVNIANGIATFEDLTVTHHLTFQQASVLNDNLTGKFLQSQNELGELECVNLPLATEEIYGVVKLTHDLKETNTDKVASATVVFQAYHALLERIKSLEESLARNRYVKEYKLRY